MHILLIPSTNLFPGDIYMGENNSELSKTGNISAKKTKRLSNL